VQGLEGALDALAASLFPGGRLVGAERAGRQRLRAGLMNLDDSTVSGNTAVLSGNGGGVFDGEVLRPEGPTDLKPNTRYVVTIEHEEEEKTKAEAIYPLTEILKLATDMGVTDLSTRHWG
jgi:hypothetical protein